MSKTPSHEQGSDTVYWPGTKIVKSLNNGFTKAPGPSLMASPAEETKARAQVNAEKARKTQIERRNGFGGHILGGLGKKAEAQLATRHKGITMDPVGSGTKRRAKTKAAI